MDATAHDLRAIGVATAELGEKYHLLDSDRRALRQHAATVDERLDAIEEALVVLDARLHLVIDSLDRLLPSQV